MSDLSKLISMCKASVHIDINEHKGVYQSVTDCMFDNADLPNTKDKDVNINKSMTYYESIMLKDLDLTADVYREMVKRDCIVKIQYYRYSAVGFNQVYHYDVDMAIKQILDEWDK